ncbi:hypothetical protein SAMN04489812_1584 [Microlunatus soli]|uniref:DUF6351 domain-containing protein n=2 Tax=Microlunatus soli TaxID=630515 RepID=A0A1H1RB44_9ACTN|nr:hypothetical protein SAMN04489812_1584 [Microlunatus soli]
MTKVLPHWKHRFAVIIGAGAIALPLALAAPTPALADPDDSATSTGSTSTGSGGHELAIETLSSRPEVVSGGDARVRITVPRNASPKSVRVRTADGDHTDEFRTTGRHTLEGVLTGLPDGRSTIVATAAGQRSTLKVTNHPITGPVFAGPAEQPFVCQTEKFKLADGSTLGPALDDDCSIEPRTDYVYRTAADTWKALPADAQDDQRSRPDDLQMITVDGRTVPFIVRIDTSTIDRGVAQRSILDDPADGTSAWNNKLIYTFGGGCHGGWYVQGTGTGGVLSPNLLSQGYGMASNSLNVFGQNCNDLIAAEAMAMTREQFIEDHGLPTFTMGVGCSGGSYQAQQIADNYPGLLDGIVVGCSFADVGFDQSQKLFDARLLDQYARKNPDALTKEQLTAISGFGSYQAVASMSSEARRMDPDADFIGDFPAVLRYDPVSNPDGARSTLWDHGKSAYGVDDRGFGRQPVDNVGVQYGLAQVRDGSISFDQFLDLNAGVGGVDIDFNPTTERTTADPEAVAGAYATGRMLNAGAGLSEIPIIDDRAWTEAPGSGDIHMRYHTFVIEQRLIKAAGDADNQVRWTEPGSGGFNIETGHAADAIEQMDDWIMAVRSSGRHGHDAVVDAKPADLKDACWAPDGTKITEPQVYGGQTRCNDLYPAYSSPRLQAGEALSADIIGCTLKPVDPDEYGKTLTEDQLGRLREVFPDGVCDWRQPGKGQRELAGSWLTFGPEPGEYHRLGRAG